VGFFLQISSLPWTKCPRWALTLSRCDIQKSVTWRSTLCLKRSGG
jgi:hypothetical protein